VKRRRKTKSSPGKSLSVAARGSVLEVLSAFTKLGLTSFGGPVAHIGYFRDEFVVRRRWLDEGSFADLVALCQFLPGPASTQFGISVGLLRAGYLGAFVAWFGFMWPSAILMVLFAYGVVAFGDGLGAGWLQGLKIAAVAVVAQAVLGMMQTLAPDRERATLAVLAAALALAVPTALGQIGAIALGGLIGFALLRGGPTGNNGELPIKVSRTVAAGSLALFFGLLAALPLLASATGNQAIAYFDAFYRVGSLVFGGGHVVLPLLQAEVVAPGWVTDDAFLAGYGAAQAIPGPLFTFAGYLGAVGPAPNGWQGAVICLVAIFLPSFLLIFATLPFWQELRKRPDAQAVLRGVNASVVGLLLAALYNPVWTGGIKSGGDFALAAAAFLLLYVWKTPPWLVVLLSAIGGAALSSF
jgi:chromate transporter